MKTIKYFLHYFFGRHKWRFAAKTYRGNVEIGHKEDTYVFECKCCPKRKVVKIN